MASAAGIRYAPSASARLGPSRPVSSLAPAQRRGEGQRRVVLRGFDGNGRGVLFQAALRPRRSRGNIRFSSHSVQNCPTKMPASAEQPFWGQKTFCVVTGASQGIGRRFAIEFGRKFGEGSVLLLLARSAQGLQETRDRVIEANPGVSVVCTPVDLVKGNATLYQSFLLNALSETSSAPGDFQLAVIVHNAGSLGDIGPGVAEHNDADQWSEFLALNITSTAVLNSEFLKVFPEGAGPSRSVINITSLCAIKPIASMGQYCVGKAAREMFFQVLAEEDSTLDVLSYSPGPVDTDMSVTIIDNIKNETMRQCYVEMKEKKTIVTCEQTTEKAIQVLANKKYKSGGRVDYYDEGF